MTGYLLFAIAVVIVALLCDPHAFDPDNAFAPNQTMPCGCDSGSCYCDTDPLITLAESLRPVID